MNNTTGIELLLAGILAVIFPPIIIVYLIVLAVAFWPK